MGELPKGTNSETIREPGDRLTEQPQEREHSGANGARGNDCPRREAPQRCAMGSSPEAKTRLPAFGT
jgi:hypothetical protein